jgi:hypothetical protein
MTVAKEFDLASALLREHIKAGKPIDDLTFPEAAQYMAKHKILGYSEKKSVWDSVWNVFGFRHGNKN